MMTHKDCEEWAAMIAQMQDDPSWHPKYNPKGKKKEDSETIISDYIKYNIEATNTGHLIKIITESGVHTIKCNWKDYKRPREVR
jgi:hypothetical protein